MDEELNRIAVGLADSTSRAAVLELAADLGVPEGMLSLSDGVSVEPTRAVGATGTRESRSASWPDHTLQDKIPGRSLRKPVLRGGYQVAADLELPSDSIRPCTLGFTAKAVNNGALRDVFVSASHCSKEPFKLDRGVWGQPDLEPQVGKEYKDPPVERCYRKWRPDYDCRNSDATLVDVEDRGIALGRLAKTKGGPVFRCNSGPDDEDYDGDNPDCVIDVDTDDPVIMIDAQRTSVVRNELLQKMGRVSGWAFGRVLETCEDVKFGGFWKFGGVTILCMDVAEMNTKEGDSGAPVFSWTPGDSAATLVGINVAAKHIKKAKCVWFCKEFVGAYISNLGQIEKDLGKFWAYDAGPPRIDRINGARRIKPETPCGWTGHVSGGMGVSYQWSGVLTGVGNPVRGTVWESGYLKLKVTDLRGRSDRDSIHIAVEEDAPGCPRPGGGGCSNVGPGGDTIRCEHPPRPFPGPGR